MYLRTSISGEIIDLCGMVNRVYSVVQKDMVKGCIINMDSSVIILLIRLTRLDGGWW